MSCKTYRCTVIPINELLNKYNGNLYPEERINIWAMVYTYTKQVPTYITTSQNKQERKYSSLTNQNVEEINITRK